MRFGRLKSLIPAISGKVLTGQLKELEEDGLLIREVVSQKPKEVEYRLTQSGAELHVLIKELDKWGKKKLKVA